MDTCEYGLTMIQVVAAFAKVKIYDVNWIHLLHFVVHLPNLDMFGNGFRHSVEYSLKKIELARELYLDNYYVALGILSLDIYTIELVVGAILIAFALK